MSLQKLKAVFIEKLKGIYPADEAGNLFNLAIENLTGINLRNNSTATFAPDGCFMKMWDAIEKRLQQSEPIQYILNEAWFYDIPFYVNQSVLIPRPETEELVDWIIKDHKEKHDLSILDIGTGSGCIPVILKRKIPQSRVSSCDISNEALLVAQKNARKHKTEINFIQSDFLNKNNWSSFSATDIIVSNPPYIPQQEKSLMHDNVLAHEPHLALFVEDSNPLIFYAAIAEAGKTLLKDNGTIYVEIFEGLGKETQLLFENQGFNPVLKKDMQGKDRFVKARK
ncbi:peptide chain release factor N(5)-glutamine methyltransferase [Niabella yanshanensis]|uniref:peptide chain release factor N(5)-glutamine methyltransferase n=1 Tax=Niabella yanshanensis TaxID=577386 RepID=A0ABZ0WAR2_9BACT|nr:peptide chain release factor N(5)-glutamine methyltransferase [Niabella yanshanensis]WQD39643.1 peptide chain release factor N(5)-glutamine methyltransferase [Niabella yanshanensis]